MTKTRPPKLPLADSRPLSVTMHVACHRRPYRGEQAAAQGTGSSGRELPRKQAAPFCRPSECWENAV